MTAKSAVTLKLLSGSQKIMIKGPPYPLCRYSLKLISSSLSVFICGKDEFASLNCRWNTSVSSFLQFLPNEQLNYESEKYRFHLLRKTTPKKISALKLLLLQFCFCNCLCLTQKPRRSFRQPSLLSCPP